jgi:DNA-binding GntR family transcriptional regulator
MLKRENLSDKLADLIGKKIIRNELESGEPINILQISKEFDVSQSPVRDALHILEKKRLVERMPKGGVRVTKMSIEFLENLLDASTIIFQYAYAKAAENATDDDIAMLQSAIDDLDESLKRNDIELFVEGSTRYCAAIAKAAGNDLVQKMAVELLPSGERIKWASLTLRPDQLKKAVNSKKKEFNYIKKKNPEMAAKEFQTYIDMHVKAIADGIRQGKVAA